ncbi:hypothetical protein Lalb_Chr23g0276251 [Lupinus albus]|uniref:Uncharacterized protein n=1 Tax=Lupinus albus TaxID=3870 RepID=A0A6A4MXM3_LUPAL|nr:hypothetical protein Lalb_Chr23g0276251 [Lupinus albus]
MNLFDTAILNTHDALANDNCTTEVQTDTAQASNNNSRVSNRIRKPPQYFSNYHCSLFNSFKPSFSSNIRYPISNHLSYEHLADKYRHFSLSIFVPMTPNTYKEATAQPCWNNAMQAELSALKTNKTWRLTTLPHDKRAIGCK